MIEKGNTQIGVNASVINLIEKRFSTDKKIKLFDIPCGAGEFLRSFKKIYSNAEILGQDLFADPVPEIKPYFLKGDAKDFSKINESFDVITSISGVMVFDNIAGLFQNVRNHLESNGYFIVTNDNILTIRDRFSFLLFGRLKRFKLLYAKDEGNWNVILIQALWKLFIQNNFELEEVIYTSMRTEDYLLIPFAILIYPFQLLYLLTAKSEMPLSLRMKLFPFKALIARHYVMIGKKK